MGRCYLNKAGEFVVQRSTQAIFKDSEASKLRKIGKIKTNLLVMHVRKKSGQSFIRKHPSLHGKTSPAGKSRFRHNGTIKGKINFNPRFKPKGDTDSERLFILS